MAGLIQSATVYGTVTPPAAILGLLCGFGLGLALFVLGALGGGDVKLLAAAGAWLGAALVVQVFLAAAVVGLVIVLTQCAIQRRLPALFRNSALVVVNLVHLREVGLDHASATGQSCRSIDRPLPYAVPVLLATVLILATGRGVI